jgi:hypothetical protein
MKRHFKPISSHDILLLLSLLSAMPLQNDIVPRVCQLHANSNRYEKIPLHSAVSYFELLTASHRIQFISQVNIYMGTMMQLEA